jgi:hypothetical protein
MPIIIDSIEGAASIAFPSLSAPIILPALANLYCVSEEVGEDGRQAIAVLVRKNRGPLVAKLALHHGATWRLIFDDENYEFVLFEIVEPVATTGAIAAGLRALKFSRVSAFVPASGPLGDAS